MKAIKTSWKRIMLAAFAALICFSFSFIQQKPKLPLDGKIFICEVYKDGKEKKYIDEDIKFTNGKFKATTFFSDWGFSSPAYNCTVIDSTSANKIYTFDCETKPSDKNEIMIWSGTVTGDDVEGTAELQKKSGKIVMSFTFTGSLKQKPQKKTPGTK